MEARTGVGFYRENFRNFVAWVEPDPKNSIFRILRVPFDYPAHSLQETVLPKTNEWYYKNDGKPTLLLVRRVCDQAFGRYRPLKGAEKWSCDH